MVFTKAFSLHATNFYDQELVIFPNNGLPCGERAKALKKLMQCIWRKKHEDN